MRLLLINPRFPESFWSFKWALERVLPGKRALNPPLGLATLAALCPPDWDIEIVDENVESIPLAPHADLVGVCGMGVQFARQRELLAYYRGRGYRTVAGGSFASLCPERYAALADTVIAGEAEYIWKEFCRDLARGAPQPLYRETGVVALADSPTPRFDLLRLDKYSSVSLQFSRGCPYRCEFCDIIVMFGRRPRTKSPEQIGRELDALRSRGARSVFFVDDNLIGHRPAAKALLRYLIDYQQRHGGTFHFGTEASINLAQDDELLALFRAAGFEWVFIGIESPDAASLEETGKTQNLRQDLLASVRRIYAHGIDVLAGFIVGFDHDDLGTFERQYRFITAAGIQVAMIGLLTALPRTPLYERLAKEGRLRLQQNGCDNTKAATNIVPKRMSYDTLVRGYRALYGRLLRDGEIAKRIRNKTRWLAHPVYRAAYSVTERLGIVWRLITRGLLPGGPARVFHFLRTLAVAPRKLPSVLLDWTAALALKDYAARRLGEPVERQQRRIQGHMRKISRACSAYVARGSLQLELHRGNPIGAEFLLRIKGRLDRPFFARGTRRLTALLKRTTATVCLHIEELHHEELPNLRLMLGRLERFGDRIYIRVHERLHGSIDVDSSVFHLELRAEPTA